MNPQDSKQNGYYDPNVIVISPELPVVQSQYANGVYVSPTRPRLWVRYIGFFVATIVAFVLGAATVIGYWQFIGSKPSSKNSTTQPAINKSSTNNSGSSSSGSNNSAGASNGNVSIAAKARDTERQADIKALSANIENYYVQNAVYPTLVNMNDAAWLKTNMPDITQDILKDPSATTTIIASEPTGGAYSYQPLGDNGVPCDNQAPTSGCISYTLTASLEAGGTYTKTNPPTTNN